MNEDKPSFHCKHALCPSEDKLEFLYSRIDRLEDSLHTSAKEQAEISTIWKNKYAKSEACVAEQNFRLQKQRERIEELELHLKCSREHNMQLEDTTKKVTKKLGRFIKIGADMINYLGHHTLCSHRDSYTYCGCNYKQIGKEWNKEILT